MLDVVSRRVRIFVLASICAGLAGCNGMPVTAEPDKDARLDECLAAARKFSRSSTVARLAPPQSEAEGKAKLERDTAMELSLDRIVVFDAVGNSLERCLLAVSGAGTVFVQARGTELASDSPEEGILTPELRATLRNAVIERERRNAGVQAGTPLGVREDLERLVRDLLRDIREALDESFRATYSVTVVSTPIDFSGRTPEKDRSFSLALKQEHINSIQTAAKESLLLWRGAGIDGLTLKIEAQRDSRIQKRFQAILDKSRSSTYFKDHLGDLLGGLLRNVGLEGAGKDIGQRLGSSIDRHVAAAISDGLDVRKQLLEQKLTLTTTLPGSDAQYANALLRGGRRFQSRAVVEGKEGLDFASMDPADFAEIFDANLNVSVFKAGAKP